jgi:YVTN family beta-propeller protein
MDRHPDSDEDGTGGSVGKRSLLRFKVKRRGEAIMNIFYVPGSIKKYRGEWCAVTVIFALTGAIMWLATHTSSVWAIPPQNPLKQTVPPGACPQTQKYEIENTSVTYTGVWNTAAGEPGDSNGQLSLSTDIGATATFTFTGTSLDLIVRTEPFGGYANVLIDGSLGPFTVEFYSPAKQYQIRKPVTSGLSNSVHIVQITVSSNPSFPPRTRVLLDAYLVGDPSLGPADPYEPDNDVFSATPLTFNTYMTGRVLDSNSDQDWISFDLQAGEVFTITTYNLAPGTDTVLTLYDTDGSTELAKNDDVSWPSDLSSQIVFTAPAAGTYYAMVAPYFNTGGCLTSYDLSLVKQWKVYLPIILKDYPPPAPTPTPTRTSTPTRTPTTGPSPTPTNTPTPSPSPTATPTGSPIPTNTPTPPPVPPPPPASCYPVVEASTTVGNDPRGVAYDGDGNMIYVANYGDGTVSVVSGGADHGVVTTIPGVAGAHGLAYDSEHKLVYVTQRDSARLAVIDARTNTVLQTIPVGNQPHGVAYNPTSDKIYVANYAADTVTVINANTMSVLATVPTGDEPAHITVNPVTNKVYVSNHGSGTVTVIHGTTNGVVTTVSLGSSGPYGIAADTQRNLIYVVSIDVINLSSANLVTIDGATDEVKSDVWGRVNIHKSDDSLVPLRVIAVHPNLGSSGHLYITSSSGDTAGDGSHGTDQLLMIRKGWPEGFNKPNPLDVGSRPEEGIAVDLDNNRVFITARYANRLTVIRDTGDHSQLCAEAFALDGYVIEPVP